MTSELKVDKITPASGTNTQIGEAGDTTNLSAGTVTLPTSIITGASEKTTLVDADKFLIADSADSNAFKHVQKSNLPSGGLQFIAGSSSSSSHGTITLDNIFSSSYRNYIVIGDFTPATNNASIELRFRNSGGTQSDSEYQQHLTRYNADSDSRNTKRTDGVNSFRFSTVGLNNDTARVGLSFHMVFWNPNDSNVRGKFYVTGAGVDNGAQGFQFNGMGQYKGTSAHTGLIFFPDSGNFSVSNVKVYGVVDS